MLTQRQTNKQSQPPVIGGCIYFRYKIFVEHCDRDVRYYSFSRRVVNPWNILPSETVDFSTLGKFKRSLQRVDFSKYLTYRDD